jgi:ribosome-binding protein aMBF1 (putative translation factor)
MVECDGCGKEIDGVGSLVVCRRRYESVCPDCMDVLEKVLEQQRVRSVDTEREQ